MDTHKLSSICGCPFPYPFPFIVPLTSNQLVEMNADFAKLAQCVSEGRMIELGSMVDVTKLLRDKKITEDDLRGLTYHDNSQPQWVMHRQNLLRSMQEEYLDRHLPLWRQILLRQGITDDDPAVLAGQNWPQTAPEVFASTAVQQDIKLADDLIRARNAVHSAKLSAFTPEQLKRWQELTRG